MQQEDKSSEQRRIYQVTHNWRDNTRSSSYSVELCTLASSARTQCTRFSKILRNRESWPPGIPGDTRGM